MSYSNQEIRYFRSIGHKLKPSVMVSENGLSEGVMAEIDRALNDHELIKVKIAVAERDDRREISETICKKLGAFKAQSIGKIILIVRRNPKPKPHLSNILRNQS